MEKNIPSSYDIFDVKILSILSQESRQTEKLFIFYCSPRVRVWWTAWTPKENNFKMEKIFGWTVFDESAEKRETSGLHFIIVRVFPSSPFLFPFFLCGKRWQAQGPSRHGTDGWRALPPVPRVPNDVVVWPFGGRRNRSGSLRRQLRRSPLKKNNNNQKKKQSVWCGRVFFLFIFFQFISISSTFFLLLLPFRAADRRRLCAPALEKEVKSGEPSADTERNIYLLILAFLFFPQLIPLLLPLLLLLLLYFPSSSSSISSGTRAPRSKSDGDVSIFFVSLRLNSVGQPIFRALSTTKKIGKKKNGKGKTVRSSSSKKREATTVGGGIERDKKKEKKGNFWDTERAAKKRSGPAGGLPSHDVKLVRLTWT